MVKTILYFFGKHYVVVILKIRTPCIVKVYYEEPEYLRVKYYKIRVTFKLLQKPQQIISTKILYFTNKIFTIYFRVLTVAVIFTVYFLPWAINY